MARAAIVVACLGCAALLPATATAGWEQARVVDHGGAYGATTKNVVAVGSNGLASVLFFQQPPGGSGFAGAPFMVRRGAGSAPAWGAPAPVATDAGQVNGFNTPELAARGNGGTLGVFAFNPTGGGTQTRFTSWPAADAAPGDAEGMLCTSGGALCAGGDPQVAVDGDGNGYAVASTLSGANGDVLFARTNPSTGEWEPADVIAQGFYPLVAVDDDGDVVVTYQRADTSVPLVVEDRLYAKRELAGESTFTSEQQLSGPETVAPVTGLVMEPTGDASALFVEDSAPSVGPLPNAGVVEAVSWPHADAQPGAEHRVSATAQNEGNATNPALAADPQGRLTAAWQAAEGPTPAIYAAQRDDAGSWGSPEQVSPQGTSDSYAVPQVAVDRNGEAMLVYQDTTPPPDSTTDALAQQRIPGGSWTVPRPIGSKAPGAGFVVGGSLRVAAAKPGQADITFIQNLSGTNHLIARRWVDETSPETRITRGPTGPTRDATPTFRFVSSEEGSTFRCRDGSGTYAPCISPFDTATTLPDGSHSFYVRATDAAGNTDPTPAYRTFRVDTQTPSSQAMAPASRHSSPFNVQYSSSDPAPSTGLAGVELFVREPGHTGYSKVATDTTPGSPVFSYTPTAGAGTYRFFTRARDRAGNYEAPPATKPDSSTVFTP
jgi:hypothetical protein